jgi:hypothetical protein
MLSNMSGANKPQCHLSYRILHSSMPLPLRISISPLESPQGLGVTRKYPDFRGFRTLGGVAPTVDACRLAVYSEAGR